MIYRLESQPSYIFSFYLGGLLPAAEAKNDTKLLSSFQLGDPVAREMRYHRSCHKKYIATVTNQLR